jgi:hypothetical protein
MTDKFTISVTTKNLFLALAESIAQILKSLPVMCVEEPTWETTVLGRQGN